MMNNFKNSLVITKITQVVNKWLIKWLITRIINN